MVHISQKIKKIFIFLSLAIFIIAWTKLSQNNHHVEIKQLDQERDFAFIERMFEENRAMLTDAPSDVSMKEIMQQKGVHSLAKVLYEGTMLAGFIFYQVDKKELGSIGMLCVGKDFRRRGYATDLLRAAIDDLIDRGIQEIHWIVAKSNKGACTLFRKLGVFIEEGEYSDRGYLNCTYLKMGMM